jgi:hypothetical protein
MNDLIQTRPPNDSTPSENRSCKLRCDCLLFFPISHVNYLLPISPSFHPPACPPILVISMHSNRILQTQFQYENSIRQFTLYKKVEYVQSLRDCNKHKASIRINLFRTETQTINHNQLQTQPKQPYNLLNPLLNPIQQL